MLKENEKNNLLIVYMHV